MRSISQLALVCVCLVLSLSAGVLSAAQPPAADKPVADKSAGGKPASGVDVTLDGVYSKQSTWAQSMTAARAAYAKRASIDAGPAGFKPFDSQVIKGDAQARQISVSVAGVKRMRLLGIIEQGVGNCHVWGEAVLVAKDGTKIRLCDIKPVSIKVGWGQLHTNENWQKQPLGIGNKTFEHGIWVHGDSEVCYALDEKYERFEAWIGLDRARATGAARFQVMAGQSDLLPHIWEAMVRDFPAQSAWLARDLAGRQLDWFRAADRKRDEDLVGKVVGELAQAGQSMARELDELKKNRAATDQAKCLELYARACRLRDARAGMKDIAIAEAQTFLQKQLDGLCRPEVSADDPQWTEFTARVSRWKDALAACQGVDASTLTASVQSLAKLPGNTLAKSDQLLKLAAQQEARWTEVRLALGSGAEASLKPAAEVAEQVKSLRRQLLLSQAGMEEFLGMWKGVDLEKEWEGQYQTLAHDLKSRAHFAKVAGETYRPEALLADSDRDPADIIIRRTTALLAHLKGTGNTPVMSVIERQLSDLRNAIAAVDPRYGEARYVLYAQACRLRRQVAFANPLLDFDKLLFVKRHRATFQHMCDQYYGIYSKPGGGVCVLSDPFKPQAMVRDVLADSIINTGRLKGQKLASGAFLSPDLSYDGQSIAFAYVECNGDRKHEVHSDPTRGHWSAGWSYHIFKANVDGSGLSQLSDGTWNDFDPCFLPNGRIAFISERRGGYLRCGRECPIYTLYDMDDSGGSITCLSYHETNEWHPSVTNDGRIIYTRWDYVDRHGCTAHHPWVTTLDGRDARAVHGNFAPRNLRADMELDVRAIPASNKLVATAAPHHGQAYGSLVLVDPQVEDDDAMAPVRRITPEVGFPESQGGPEAYGTPWPLSEDFFLCAYDDAAVLKKSGAGNYGLYLVDAFGNRELIYRDATIASQSPMPLRPRTKPAVAPVLASHADGSTPSTRPAVSNTATEDLGQATIVVVNAYESLQPWPKGTQIKALRVLQVMPMSVPSGAPPHDTGLRVKLAEDSVNVVRHVLGTVPVESDGSAHFTVPANKEIFFQALDERGLAVQSMRSATYLHAGERLVCQGCHEPKHTTPKGTGISPLAARRAPSIPKPDVDGSNPYSYPRLVQPVLDRNCVDCHAKNADKAMNLGREPIQRHWYASYLSLAPKFGFHSYGQGYVTTPGQFGAKASKLLELLEKGHYDVKLSPEDFHRLTLWLDCCSLFYGVYEKDRGEAQLRGEIARPTLE